MCCANDCGIVVNPDGANNQTEGCVVDGIGVAMYGGLSFRNGATNQDNLDNYRMIRNIEAPIHIDVHYVENDIDPTGLGEPPYPPVMGALANALYKATGKRYYDQPFFGDWVWIIIFGTGNMVEKAEKDQKYKTSNSFIYPLIEKYFYILIIQQFLC